MAESAGYSALVTRDWTVPQGADTVNVFRYGTQETSSDPIVYPDLSTGGWSARAQFRSAVGGEVWVEFLSSSVSGPRISLEPEGYVYIILPHETTEDTDWNLRQVGFYDLELESPTNFVTRLAEGMVTVKPDVTRLGV